jgi:hypothetical protein
MRVKAATDFARIRRDSRRFELVDSMGANPIAHTTGFQERGLAFLEVVPAKSGLDFP